MFLKKFLNRKGAQTAQEQRNGETGLPLLSCATPYQSLVHCSRSLQRVQRLRLMQHAFEALHSCRKQTRGSGQHQQAACMHCSTQFLSTELLFGTCRHHCICRERRTAPQHLFCPEQGQVSSAWGECSKRQQGLNARVMVSSRQGRTIAGSPGPAMRAQLCRRACCCCSFSWRAWVLLLLFIAASAHMQRLTMLFLGNLAHRLVFLCRSAPATARSQTCVTFTPSQQARSMLQCWTRSRCLLSTLTLHHSLRTSARCVDNAIVGNTSLLDAHQRLTDAVDLYPCNQLLASAASVLAALLKLAALVTGVQSRAIFTSDTLSKLCPVSFFRQRGL